MARLVTVNVDNTMLGGVEYDSGAQVRISDAEFTALTSAGRFTDGTLDDDGNTANEGDEVFDQAAAVAAPAALTATAPAAMTQAAITGGESPTEAEFNALRADVAALRGTVAALVTDMGALRTTVAALQTALSGTGKPLAT